MQNNMICAKVNSMLALYIDKKLTQMQSEFVEDHLATCNSCRAKYDYLKKLISTLKDSYSPEKISEKSKVLAFKINEYEYYKQNLSAYFDNELPFEDSVRFKKYIMKIPLARKELQNVYDLQQLLKKNWHNNQKKLSQDFSKIIINRIYKDNKYMQTTIWTKVAAVIFAVSLLGGASAFYYFAKNKQEPKPIENRKEVVADVDADNDVKPDLDVVIPD